MTGTPLETAPGAAEYKGGFRRLETRVNATAFVATQRLRATLVARPDHSECPDPSPRPDRREREPAPVAQIASSQRYEIGVGSTSMMITQPIGTDICQPKASVRSRIFSIDEPMSPGPASLRPPDPKSEGSTDPCHGDPAGCAKEGSDESQSHERLSRADHAVPG
jgi:hypothetical protein